MTYAIATAREAIDTYGQSITSFENAYANYFSNFGLQLLILPINSYTYIKNALKTLPIGLIVLTGGGSVPKSFYVSDNGTHVAQPCRDQLEEVLLCHAIENNIPVIGICRGMQFINGFLGGKISNKFNSGIVHNIGIHAIISNENEYFVNSFHNDFIQSEYLAEELEVIATTKSDSIIEAFKSKTKRILGIQWHPERKITDPFSRRFTDNLIKTFINAEVTQ